MRGTGGEWITSLQDIHDHKLASERRDLLLGESRHRLKNLFTVIEALAKSSRDRSQPAVEQYLNRFLGRMRAIAMASDILLTKQHRSIECSALVRATLGPFSEDRAAQFHISGSELFLSEETGATLGLAIHEMATNALKYGALSTDDGTVSVAWSVALQADGQELVTFEWRERGGPPSTTPEKEGFGMRLIRSVPARERNGEATVEFRAEGFSCRISFVRPLATPEPLPAAAE
jgi:two-component sensor histidine kinase